MKARRLYQVKLLIEDFNQPGSKTVKLADAKRIVVVIGDILRPQSIKDFDSVTTAESLKEKSPSSGKSKDVRSRTFIATRMESELD